MFLKKKKKKKKELNLRFVISVNFISNAKYVKPI